jgi:hypothetical protein
MPELERLRLNLIRGKTRRGWLNLADGYPRNDVRFGELGVLATAGAGISGCVPIARRPNQRTDRVRRHFAGGRVPAQATTLESRTFFLHADPLLAE